MESEIKKNTVSYSQYSEFSKCPRCWKLGYIDKLKKYENSINTAFGTALHKAIQTYLTTLYDKSLSEADSLKLFPIFEEEFKAQLCNPQIPKDVSDKERQRLIGLNSFISPQSEIDDFMQDGKDILDFFLKTDIRSKYFPSKKYELIGIEVPLEIEMRKNLKYKGFIDLVLKDKITNKILIYDIKSSTNGWNKWQKADDLKMNQLLLYKKFYSKLHNVDEKDISVEFFILKRKLYENVSFEQSRLQKVIPNTDKPSMNNAIASFMKFINYAFDKDGNYNKNAKYPKNPGKAKKNCKYCSFKGTEYCDGKSDNIDE